jgi:hypothetical protein
MTGVLYVPEPYPGAITALDPDAGTVRMIEDRLAGAPSGIQVDDGRPPDRTSAPA